MDLRRFSFVFQSSEEFDIVLFISKALILLRYQHYRKSGLYEENY